MATTWAATASNQAVTREALQDALNSNVFNWSGGFVPTTDITKCVNKDDSWRTYVNIDIPTSVDANQLMVKSDFVVPSGSENGTGVGGRRDGDNVYLRSTFSSSGNSNTIIIDSPTCKTYGVYGNTTGTITFTVRNLSNQDIKFWIVEGGTTCPIGGTEYNSYVHNPTLKKNFLIVPVWTGSSYVLV